MIIGSGGPGWISSCVAKVTPCMTLLVALVVGQSSSHHSALCSESHALTFLVWSKEWSFTEMERLSDWLPWSSLGTLKLETRASSIARASAAMILTQVRFSLSIKKTIHAIKLYIHLQTPFVHVWQRRNNYVKLGRTLHISYIHYCVLWSLIARNINFVLNKTIIINNFDHDWKRITLRRAVMGLVGQNIN